MGLIFDEKTAERYQDWYRSPQGKAVEAAVENLLTALLDSHRRERVLDIGSGFGDHLLMLGRMGLDITGIDASPHMILRARKRLGHRCALRPAFAEDLPFEDNEFDLAVFILTMEFLDDPLQALREAGRVARRKVFICAMNGLSYPGAQKWLKGQLGHPLFGRTTFFNPWRLKRLLREAFGNSPTEWASGPIPRRESTGENPAGRTSHILPPNPFRFVLGVSVTLRYTVKTDNLPIQVGIKQAPRSLMDAGSFPEFHSNEGLQTNERSISV